jgi:hypothetical protein
MTVGHVVDENWTIGYVSNLQGTCNSDGVDKACTSLYKPQATLAEVLGMESG